MTGGMLGPYRVLEKLGAGGMGEVYKARDTRLDRVVAIKILPERFASDPAARSRFEREARAISHLNDAHICTLHDIGREGDTDFLVMEFLEGQTLAARLERGPLPIADVLRYGRDIAHALDRAHRAGIVHRDLKPANIMLVGVGGAGAGLGGAGAGLGGAGVSPADRRTRQAPAQVKLMDFGLARAFEADEEGRAGLTQVATVSRPVTAEGAIVGTLNYMAPEQLEAGETDARTDVWALGCVLYEMSTGKRPFEGGSQASLVAAIMDREPEPLARVQPLSPPALEHVVSRCLAKDPAERWQSARDVAHDLEWLAQGTGATVAQVPAAPPRRRRWVLAAAVLVPLLTVMGVLAFLAGHKTAPRQEPPKFTRLTFQRGFVSAARFLTGGQDVVYSASREGLKQSVYQTRVGSIAPPVLRTAGYGLLSVSGPGEFLLSRNADGLLGMPRPLDRVGASGAPRPIADAVTFAEWDRNRAEIVVRRENAEDRLEWPIGSVKTTTHGFFSDVRLAPDGRRVALIEHPLINDFRGVVTLWDGNQKTALSDTLSNVTGLAWSPDGREIWYSGTRGGVRQVLFAVDPVSRATRTVLSLPLSIILQDISGGRVLMILRRPEVGVRGRLGADDRERELGWMDYAVAKTMSSDGRTILFDDEGEGGGPGYSVYARQADGSAPVPLDQGAACALSPDGRSVLALELGPPQQLVLISRESSRRRPLPKGALDSYQNAAFLPDGRIAVVGSARGKPPTIWVQDPTDGEPRMVSAETVLAFKTTPLTVSPSGDRLAARNEAGLLQVFPLAGGAAKPLRTLEPPEQVCQWSQDGRTLYTYSIGSRLEAFAVDVASGERRPWKTFELPDPVGAAIFNLVLSRDGRNYAYTYLRFLDELYVVDGLR